MANKELILEFTNEGIRFQNEESDCIIGEAKDPQGKIVSLKGTVESGEQLTTGCTYRFFGTWKEYRGSPQFVFNSFVVSLPQSRESIISYLAAICEGIGKKTAERIYDLAGDECLSRMRDTPEYFSQHVSRLRSDVAQAAAEKLKKFERTEKVTIEVNQLLEKRGFPKGTPSLAIAKWKTKAAEVIRRNPYRLMEFRGCGFLGCDKLYLDLGLPPGRLKRQALCAAYGMQKNQAGNTWVNEEVINQLLRGAIGQELDIPKAIRLATRANLLRRTWTDGAYGPPDIFGSTLWFAQHEDAFQEAAVARMVAEAMHEKAEWPQPEEVEGLYDHQAAELREALSGGSLAILGGGPGVGKTITAVSLIRALIKKFGAHHIGIGAPTGKAAVRLNEALFSMGVTSVTARTWDSMLFQLTDSGHFPYAVLVGDESSMLSLSKFHAVMEARAPGTLFFIVGDVNQLPPVEHGAPLRDLLHAGVPQGVLTETHRNAGRIVGVCHAIRRNEAWKPSEKANLADGENLIIQHTTTDQAQEEEIYSQVKQQATKLGVDAVWDVQVIVATNKARQKMNRELQERLNSNEAIQGSPFRVKDKVINLENGWLRPARNDSNEPMVAEEAIVNQHGLVYAANGEMGKVIECRSNFLRIELQNPWRVIETGRAIDAKEGTGCSFDLGYAVTCHKMQGSACEIAIVHLDAKGNCDRSWLYTAISRARTLCVLVGQKSIANKMCAVNRIDQRKTFLREHIVRQKAEFATQAMEDATTIETANNHGFSNAIASIDSL